MTMPPLPPPDLEEHETELWGQNVCDDYWRLAKVKAYGAACAAAEREAIAKMLDEEQRQDRWSNHAGVYARMVRERSKT